ncbi:MAG: hypothetical protein ACN4E2_00690 [Nitrospinota bacterium]
MKFSIKVGKLLALIYLLTMAGSIFAAETQKNNRVVYGNIETKIDIKQFLRLYSQLKSEQVISLSSYLRENDDQSRRLLIPYDQEISDNEKSLISLNILSQEAACEEPSKAIFIFTPLGEEKLLSYDYILCDKTRLLKPAGMIRNYVIKYGLFNFKNFDKNQIVYTGVQSKYKVAVMPAEKIDENVAIRVTIVDDSLFKAEIGKLRAHLELLYIDLRSRL